MKVRISTDSYSQGDYSYQQPSQPTNWATPRVVIDSQGLVHDPDFISNILSEQRDLLAKRRAESDRRAKRLSQSRLIYDPASYSDSEDDEADPYDNFYTVDHNEDPFAGPSTASATTALRRRSAQSYFAETPNMEARRAARQQTQTRRSSTLASSPNTYLSSPVSMYASDSIDTTPEGSPGSSAERWSLPKPRKEKRALLKKKEPEQHVFTSFEEDEEDEERQRLQIDQVRRKLEEEDEEDTPTCGEVLKKQWQSVVLRVTLTTFRARRQLRHKKRHPELNEKYGT